MRAAYIMVYVSIGLLGLLAAGMPMIDPAAIHHRTVLAASTTSTTLLSMSIMGLILAFKADPGMRIIAAIGATAIGIASFGLMIATTLPLMRAGLMPHAAMAQVGGSLVGMCLSGLVGTALLLSMRRRPGATAFGRAR